MPLIAVESVPGTSVTLSPPTHDRPPTQLKVLRAEIPVSWLTYPGESFTYDEAAFFGITVTMPAGSYTTSTLPAAIKAALETASAASGGSLTFTVSYDSTSGLLSWSAGGPTFTNIDLSSAPYFRTMTGFTVQDGAIGKEEASNVAQVGGDIGAVYITSPELGPLVSYPGMVGAPRDAIARITVDQPQYSVINWDLTNQGQEMGVLLRGRAWPASVSFDVVDHSARTLDLRGAKIGLLVSLD